MNLLKVRWYICIAYMASAYVTFLSISQGNVVTFTVYAIVVHNFVQ